MLNYFYNMFGFFAQASPAASPALPLQAAPATPVPMPSAALTPNPAVTAMPEALPQAAQSAIPMSLPAGSTVIPMNIWQYILLFVYFIVCAMLIFFVLIQTSKGEGLMGTLGGSTQSIFKGKKSVEEQLGKITAYTAVAFIALSILIAWLAFR